MQTFLPIILGSDENAYGTVRLFREAYGIRPLLVCTRRLIPTMDSSLFDLVQIEGFDRDEIFRRELLRILKQHRPHYDKLLVIACSDYYAGMMSKYHADFDPWIANRFLSPAPGSFRTGTGMCQTPVLFFCPESSSAARDCTIFKERRLLPMRKPEGSYEFYSIGSSYLRRLPDPRLGARIPHAERART